MTESHPAHLLCPIDENKKEIRLFKLLSDRWNAPIRCTFTKVSLAGDEQLSYTTLSYVWGDPLDKYTIVLDDLEFPVTKNLFLALRRIRAHMAGQLVTFWADALCIDQVNVKEQNQQVQLMRKIYSKCREVILWMGEIPPFKDLDGTVMPQKDDESETPTKCYEINESSNNTDTHEFAQFMEYSSLRIPSTTSPSDLALHVAWFMRELSRGVHMSDLPPFCSEIYDSSTYFSIFQQTVDFLCGNPWFHRLWVIQEAVLAPSVRVLYGSTLLPLDMLVSARKVLDAHMPNTCCLSSGPGHFQLRTAIRNFLTQFASIQWLRDERRADRLSKPLLELCLTFPSRQTSLSVDRVYALNGLAPAKCIVGALVPDYHVAPYRLFQQVSRDYILGTSSMLPLMFSGLKARYPTMPSWVIDWTIFDKSSKVNFAATVNMMGAYRFNTLSEAPPARFDGDCLLAKGFIYDSITEVTEAVSQSEDWDNGSWCGDWLALVSKNRSPEHSYPHLSSQSWNEAWLRTLCNDLCYGQNNARRINKLDIEFFSAMISENHSKLEWQTRQREPRFSGKLIMLENGHEVPADAHLSDLFMMMRIATIGRKLFMTKKGYLGIGNLQTSLGDQIAILEGGQTPLILRIAEPHRVDSLPSKLVFRVMSEGYLHGLMDGESIMGGNPLLTTIMII